MKKLWLVSAGMAFILALTFNLHAQEAPDSIVQVAAEAQGLNPVSWTDVPEEGTFWLVMSNGIVPDPAPPFDPGLPIYAITTNGEYLVDDTDGQVATEGEQTVAEALAALADEVTNLINQIQNPPVNQSATRSRMAGSIMTMDEGGGFSPDFNFDTNGLFLQVMDVTNGEVDLMLNNATDEVYEVMSKTDLSATNWTIEPGEVWPTNATAMPFTVPEEGRTNLFIWAMDWTGVTENGNTTPDWWFWENFGTVDLSDTNLDNLGNTLLYDYTNGIDPNVITFTLSVTNNYVNSMSAPLQVSVTAGVPSYYAVLVDDLNFSDASWQPYTSSNITVNLGFSAGGHDVWVGLRGYSPNATQAWQCKRLNLLQPPVLVITNPATDVVDEPMIQIYGYCQDSLASINYDISNAVGVATNQPSEITDRYFDTNVLDFTTNYFECLDVPLTNGLNAITIYATDLAGDTTTTNFNFTLDYSGKTNPPVVQITWPTNGTEISGSNFTCRGWISDPTATMATQLVFTNGSTNVFPGGIYTNTYVASVERNGNFWLENLPLNAGTNAFTLTVTDAVGNTSVTNISVIQSSLVLTINPVTPDSQLWQSTVNLTGTISDSTYAVWVNGVKGHNNGDGTWSVTNAPVNSGGTASFTAVAYAPTEQQPDGSYGN